jgi:hypothetical protein
MDKIKFNKDLLDKNGQPFATRADDSALMPSSILTWDEASKQLINGGFTFQDLFWFLGCLQSNKDAKFHVYPVGITEVGESDSSTSSFIPTTGAYLIEDIATILIPNSVTKIDYYAFMGLAHVKKIIIPNSVTSIGDQAFYGCTSLLNDYPNFREDELFWCPDYNILPSGLITLGSEAFKGCTALKTISIPSSTTSVGKRVFEGCTGLTHVHWHGSAAIEDYAFISCFGLKSIDISGKIPSIGTEAFKDCVSLEKITIPLSVNSVGRSAFRQCDKLEIVRWDSNANISESAFEKCSKLFSINITGKPTEIKSDAFLDCKALKSITIPDSVKTIGERAFSNAPVNDLYIPYSVEEIGDNAFSHEHSSSSTDGSLEFGTGSRLTKIGNYAFDKAPCACGNITIPQSVTELGDYVFRETAITRVAFEQPDDPNIEAVTSIPHLAFSGCEKLQGASLPSNLTNIGAQAFYGCSTLGWVRFGTNTAATVKIPSSVTHIGTQAFAYTDIRYVELSCNTQFSYFNEGAEEPSVGIFQNCKSLQEVSFHDIDTYDYSNAQSLPESMFAGCTKLTTVALSPSISGIANDAFRDCTALHNIEIPKEAEYISHGAFAGCRSLAYIYYDGTLDDWTSLIGASGAIYSDPESVRNLLFDDGNDEGLAPQKVTVYLSNSSELIYERKY